MNIEELITSYGGFVYSDETKSMPKDYLTSMVETYIVFPNKVSQTGKVPKYAEKYIKLSLTNNWPIINSSVFDDLTSKIIDMTEFDICEYVWKHLKIETCYKNPVPTKFSQKKFWSSGYLKKRNFREKRYIRRKVVQQLKDLSKEVFDEDDLTLEEVPLPSAIHP